VGLETNKVKATWASAGFTGEVNFNQPWPPHYTITAQSRAAGSSVACTVGITVSG
jgi:hypothetical protein